MAGAQAAVVDVSVSGPGGDAARGREVVLHNESTGFAATNESNASGRARFTGVPAAPGYAVTVDGVELASGIRLRSNQSCAVTVRLLDDITVTGKRLARPNYAINTLDAEVSASLNRRELQTLPIEARGLSRALIRLPNVVPSTGFFPEAPPVSINGANGLFTQYLIDGLDNNENFVGGPKFPISTGFASDVTVLASSYSVEYGRTGNGVVNVTSRSGSNDWFGELFYLVRPGPPIDASSPFASRLPKYGLGEFRVPFWKSAGIGVFLSGPAPPRKCHAMAERVHLAEITRAIGGMVRRSTNADWQTPCAMHLRIACWTPDAVSCTAASAWSTFALRSSRFLPS